MSKVKTDAIETRAGGTSVQTIGTATQTIKLPGGTPGAGKFLQSDADGDASWATVASKDNLPAFYMTFTGGDQDITDAVITLINWNTSIYDTASGLNTTATGTNPRSYTVQTGGDGKWFLTWGVYCYGTASRERSVEGNIYKNGSMVHTSMHSQTANDGFGNHTCAGSVVIELVATDYVTVYGLVDVHSGTPRIASHAGATWFSGFRLAE